LFGFFRDQEIILLGVHELAFRAGVFAFLKLESFYVFPGDDLRRRYILKSFAIIELRASLSGEDDLIL
jgi:hypothetical protein